MSNYIALTKILLKNSLNSFTNSKNPNKRGNKVKSIALMALLVFSLLPLAGAIGATVFAAYPVFKEMGQEGLILGSGLVMISMMVLFFGIFYVMNIFYFSKDVDSLLPLPLRPSTIMAAKFTVSLLYEYLTELLFLAPVIVSFGIVSKAGIVYYLYSLIGFLTLPVIPLIYSGILNMVLMRFTNLSKNRDQFRIIGGVIAMLVAVLANIKMQSFFSGFEDPEKIKSMLQSNNSLLGVVSGIFPANKLLAIGLVNSNNVKGLINILLFLGISILFTVLFLTLGESLYFKGLIGITETKSKRRKLTSEQFEKSVVRSPVMKAFIVKEFRLLFRTPIYFINCVMMNFLWPLFLMIPFFAGSQGSLDLNEMRNMIRAGSYEGIVLAIAFVAVLFATGSNGITSTSISREGSNIFISKYLPVSYHDQIMAKVFTGVILGFAALFSMLAAVVFAAMPPLYLVLLIIVAGVVGVFYTSLIGIMIDLNFPKLNWDNEQRVVKQNMNVVVHMLVSAVPGALILIPAIILKMNVWVVFAAIVAVFGFIDAIIYGLIKSAGVSLFKKIEA